MSSANIRRAGFGFSDALRNAARAASLAIKIVVIALSGHTALLLVEGYETAWACCNGSDCPGLITTNPTLNTVPISSTDPTSTHSPSVTPSVTPTSTHSPSVTPSVTPPRVTPPSVAPESKTPSTTAPSTILPTIKPATIPSPSRTLDTDPPIITITRHSSPTIPAPTPSVYTTSGFVRTITPTPTLTTHAAVTINPNGNGDFLVGYCATAQFTGVIDAAGTAIFYIQVVGCIGDKPDCCPISTTDQVSTTATEIVTIFQSQSGAPNPPPNQYLFPSGPSSAIDLVTCPDDYQTISSVCCPSGFQLWTEALGGQTPCYTTTSDHADPPPLTDLPTFSFSASPTISTVVNVVYAMNYPVRKKSGLKTSAIAGIGVGSAVATALVAALVYAVLRSRRTRDRDSTQYPPMVVQPYSPMQAYSPVYPAMQSDDYVRPP
ncbi:MAG: hypothetical protein M1840_001728 [Geoglossum simile]|nr:MAG: hypothetical protein M1840_001728 [Geoglossum simile]